MANRIGVVLALDGEREFTAALQTAQREARQFQTQLRGLSQEFEGQANSMQYLTQRQQLLTQQQQAYQRRLDAARQGADRANQNYREMGRRLEELRGQLQDAQDALDGMEEGTDAYNAQAEAVRNLQEQINQQAIAHTREAGSIADWNRRVSESQQALNSANRELEQNEQYLREAQESADGCAHSINNMGEEVEDSRSGFGGLVDSLRGVITGFDDAGDSAGVFGGTLLGNLASSAVEKGLDLLKEGAEAVKEAMYDTSAAAANLGAQTGATEEQMEAYRDVMNEIKGDNFGETYNDVAEAIGVVVQSMGELDNTDLKNVTESVMTLQDTFGYDYQESINAVKMLMEQFGVTSEQAFNLIVQGAQQGLDKNGDLLDSINEYAVHYAQLGATADDFFNSLKNGTDAGTFSVDKLGDAYKEFGIRVRDTADSTTEGFELIGLDADEMREKFAAGGESAREATEEVVTALMSMDDKVRQNQAGVDLFGTMWEDLGSTGIAALMNLEGGIDSAKTAMQSLADVKYSDLESAIGNLGATVQEKFVTPIAEKALPLVTDAINGITELIDPTQTEFETFITGIEEANTQLETSMQNAQTTVANAEAEASRIQLLGDQLIELNAVEEKSTAQRYQMSAVVQELGQYIPEVATAYDEEAGKVRLTNTEIQNLIASTQDLIVAQAVQASNQELINDLVDAQVQYDAATKQMESQKGLIDLCNESLDALAELDAAFVDGKIDGDEYNEGLLNILNGFPESVAEGELAVNNLGAGIQNVLRETTNEYEETSQEADKLGKTIKEGTDEINKSETAARELTDAMKGESEAAGEAAESQDDLAAAAERHAQSQDMVTSGAGEYVTALEDETSAHNAASEAASGNSGALEELTEEEKAAAEAARAGAQAQREAASQIVEAYHGYVDEIKSDLQEKINPFEKFDTETGFGEDVTVEEMIANLESQAEAFQEYEEKLAEVKEHVGKEIAPEFMEYIESMGIEGTNMLDHILATFADEEPEKVKQLSDSWCKAMNITDGIAEAGAANRVAYEAAMGELGSTPIEFKGLRESIEQAKTNAVEGWDGLSEETAAKLEEVVQTAEQIGIKIPEGLADGIADGSVSPESAIEQLNGSIEGAFDGLEQMAEEAGIEIPEGLEEAIESGGQDAIDAYQTLVQALIDESQELQDQTATEIDFSGLTDAIEEAKENAVAGWEGLSEETAEQLSQTVEAARTVGAQIPEGLAAGIASGEVSPESAVQQLTEAIRGQYDGLAQAAMEAGLQVPENITAGIESGDPATMAAAYQSLIDYVTANANTETLAQIMGEAGVEGAAQLESHAGEAEAAGTTLGESGATGAESTQSQYTSAGTESADQFNSGLQSGVGGAAAAGGALGSAGYNAAASYTGSFYSVGVNMASGVASGIRAGASGAVNAAVSMVSQALAAAKAAAEIASPSKKFRKEVGHRISEGVAFGIDDKKSYAVKAAEELSADVLKRATAWLTKYKDAHKVSLADEKWYWKQVVKYIKDGVAESEKARSQMGSTQLQKVMPKIQARFGVSTTETTGSGKNQKTVAKDMQDYYSEIYSAAKKYMDNLQVLSEWSAEQQKAYWVAVQGQLRVGTQAWYDAQKQINDLNDEIAENAADLNDRIVSAAEDEIERIKITDGMSVTEEREFWEAILKTVKKGTDAWYEAKKHVKDAKEEERDERKQINSDILSDAEDYVEHQKLLNKMDATEERKYWQDLLKQFKKGSDEWWEVKQHVIDAKQEEKDERKAANDAMISDGEAYVRKRKLLGKMNIDQEIAYWEEIQTHYKKGSDNWCTVEEKLIDLREEKAQETAGIDDEILANAQEYVRKEKIVNGMSEEAELAYWETIIKTLKQGSDAWYTALETINNLKAEHAETAVDINEQIYSDAQEYVRKQKALNAMSEQEEMEYWQGITDQLEVGSDEWYDAYETSSDLRDQMVEDARRAAEEAQSAADEAREKAEEAAQSSERSIESTLSVQKSLLSKYKSFYDVSAKAEMEYWDIARGQFAAGTAERIQADQMYQQAHDAYYEQLADVEEDYADKKLKVDEDLQNSIEELQDTYENAVKSREDEIKSSFNLFDDWDAEGWDPDTLMRNLEHQVEGLDFWQDQLDELAGKGLSEDFLKELKDMGPDAAANLWSLNQMTAEQLDKYQAMWKQKNDMAHRQAVEDNEDLLEETQNGIEAARKKAKDELAEIEKDYRDEIAKLNTGLSDGLKSLVTQSKEIGEDMIDALVGAVSTGSGQIDEMIQASKKKAQEAAQAAQKAYEDAQRKADAAKAEADRAEAEKARQDAAAQEAARKAEEERKAKEEAEKKAAEEEAAKAAEEARKQGELAAQQAAQQQQQQKPQTQPQQPQQQQQPQPTPPPVQPAQPQKSEEKKKTDTKDTDKKKSEKKQEKKKDPTKAELKAIIKQGVERSKQLTKEEKEQHHELWKYLVKNYGRKPNDDIYTALADAFGLKVSKSPTSEQKDELLKLLKKKGLESGTREIRENALQWVLEHNQSEYVMRKKDGAILQPMGVGDKVVNPAGANVLYDFANDPTATMSKYMSRNPAAFVDAGTAGIERLNRIMGGGQVQVIGMDNSQTASLMRQMLAQIDDISDQIRELQSRQIVMDTGALVGQLQKPLSRANAAVINRQNRGGLR